MKRRESYGWKNEKVDSAGTGKVSKKDPGVAAGNRQFKNLNGFNIDERFEQEILPYIREIDGGGKNE